MTAPPATVPASQCIGRLQEQHLFPWSQRCCRPLHQRSLSASPWQPWLPVRKDPSSWGPDPVYLLLAAPQLGVSAACVDIAVRQSDVTRLSSMHVVIHRHADRLSHSCSCRWIWAMRCCSDSNHATGQGNHGNQHLPNTILEVELL